MMSRLWLIYALTTTIFWGVWGAFIEIPEKSGFPATLGYTVWALTMIPPSLIVLKTYGWKLDTNKKSVFYGLAIGLLGSMGQLVLFQALRVGPAYIVFPVISLSPLLTILMSYTFLKERASGRSWIGIVIALIAMPLLSYQPSQNNVDGFSWLFLSLFVFIAWGMQAYFIKLANRHTDSSSIFFYMMASGIALIPIALLMTDFDQNINWGLKGPYLAACIQMLNSVGALCIVYAFRHGKAIIVSPLINAGAPIITIVLSLLVYGKVPDFPLFSGMVLAVISIFLIAEEQ